MVYLAGYPEGIALNQPDRGSETLPKANWIRTDKVVSLNRAGGEKIGQVSATVRLQAVHPSARHEECQA